MSKGDISNINIIYNINENYEENINIFGSKFVKNNKDICRMIIDDKEYEITEKYNIEKYNNNELKIKLKGIDNITNMSYMFSQCSSLLSLSLSSIPKSNVNKVTDMSYMFYGCALLSSLSGISKWNTNNVTDINGIFYQYSSLTSLPDI